jgi:hypothetical protein
MMKTLKLIVLFSAISISGSAQTFFPKAGVTFSQIGYSDLSGNKHLYNQFQAKPRIGFTVGIGFNIPINEHYSVQPELSFVQKGTIAGVEGGPSRGGDYKTVVSWEHTVNIKINYLELPFLFKYSVGDKRKFFVIAGPSLSLGLGGTISDSYRTIYEDGTTDGRPVRGKVRFFGADWQLTYADEGFDNFYDIGLNLGGGMHVAKQIMIDVRYNHGFVNLYAPEGSSANNSKNRSVQFTVGIPIQIPNAIKVHRDAD